MALSDAELLDLARRTPPGTPWRHIKRMHDLDSPSDARQIAAVSRVLPQLQPVQVHAGKAGVVLEAPVTTVEELARISQIDLDEYRVGDLTPIAWTGQRKGGEPVQLYRIKAQFHRRLDQLVRAPDGPELALDAHQPGPLQCLVALPDSQHGFRRIRHELVPMHDRRAIHAAEQLVEHLQPDHLVDLGDGLDLPTLSKYLTESESIGLTEPAIWAKHWQLRRLAEVAPHASRVYIGSNHDDRVYKRVSDQLSALQGVRPAGEARPALSIERLLSLDRIGWAMSEQDAAQPGVQVVGGGRHGTEAWYFDGRLRCTHGDSAAKHAAEKHWAATHSTLFGHIHRWDWHGGQAWHLGTADCRLAMSPGCLCRVDELGPPPRGRKDWQQGVAVVWWDGQHLSIELAPIHDGVLTYGGRRFVGQDRDDLAAWRAAA